MPAASTGPQPVAERPRGAFARTVDRIPTVVLLIAGAALVLGVVGLFGGLDDAPSEPLTRVQPGQEHVGAQLTIVPERAMLVDTLPEAFLEPEDGSRVLVVTSIVTNTWDRPVLSSEGGASDNLRPDLPGLEAPENVLLLLDGTRRPWLEPHLPAELAFAWTVPEDALADGDALRVNLYDKVYRAEGFVTVGERFQEPFLAAYTELEVEDLGAGADG